MTTNDTAPAMTRHTTATITDDALDDLYRRITTLEHVAAGNKRHVQLIVPDLERAQAALNRVRALHQPLEHKGHVLCAHCSGWNGMWLFNGPQDYPCDTLTALAEPTEEKA